MSPIQVAQTSSPLFRLPAEIRFAIYELLDLPPIDNEQCRGLILSCRQAKHECERVSIRTTKAWLLAYKQDVLSQSELGVRILLPIITRTPVGMHSKFHTLRNLTLVVPGHRIHDCGYQDPKFFESLRPLNAIFSLWLDSLTLHFSGSLRSGPGHRMYMHIGKSFRRLFFVLESGLTYAHDPVGQKGNLKLNKYSSSVKHWRPQPAFIKKLVVSWDLTEEGLRSEDLVAVDGHCRKPLAHNRLAIVDLNPEGEQPFHDEGSTIHAVVNGELYGYQEIRDCLSREGYKFKSQSDSEIALALYKKHGLSFLSHLRGEFSLCLYDSEAQIFIAACDRYAIKPMYYTVLDGKLLVASEMKAFLPFGWQPEWDVQSIKDVGWLCDGRTIFQSVSKILPGHYLLCRSFGTISQDKYWDVEFKDKRELETRSEDEMIQGVRKHLLDAVRDRLRADVPIGVFLSGGIDSSAIAGMVKHLMDTEGAQLGTAPASERINCFSVKFIGEEHDEEPIARRTADWLGVKMHHCEMTEENFAANIENAVWHNETAVTDLGTVGKFLLSKLTSKEGIKVVLTGEGSDEHFAGYRELLTDFVREPDLAWPNSCLPEEERIATFKGLEGSDTSGPKELVTSAAVRAQVNNTSFLGFTQTASLRDPLFAPWVFGEFGTTDKRLTAVNAIDGRTRELMTNKWHPLHTSLYIWTKSSLANGLLTVLGDRCEMAHSVEGRQPFLDHRLTEYAMKLPPSVKLHYDPSTRTFSEKWILKEAMKPFITTELYARKKHPFSAPVKYKPDGPVHKLFEKLLTKENVEALGFLEWDKCKDLLHDAIYDGDRPKWSQMILVGQFVILSQKFGVKKAAPEFVRLETNGFAR
ncbi:hypothetical protein B0T12DRAFT_347084 [Alternaria alternata]|nr:hypothetical protein B0T12DRAFT_347084 [Alternaria alternata]